MKSRFYLDPKELEKIRLLLSQGVSTRVIGMRFGIRSENVRRAVK